MATNANDLPIAGNPNGQSINQVQGKPVGTGGINAMTPESLSPATPINLPPPVQPNDTSAGVVGAAGAAGKSLQDYITALTPPQTAADKQSQDLLNSISDITGSIGNKGQDQATAEANAGIPDKQTALQNLNNELTLKTAQYDKQFTQLGGSNGTVESNAVLNAQQGGLKLAQAADLGITTAKITAAQGNLKLAQDQVNRAIDLKYSTLQAQLDTKKAQLDALAPTLNKEDRITALAQQQKLQDQAQALADKKTDEKANINLALQANVQTNFVNQNGKFYDARTGQTFSDPAEFFKAAGVSSFAEAYQKGLVTDVNGSTMADQNFAAQAQAKYGDAGIKLTDTPDQVKAKLQNSRIYKKDTYIVPPAGSSTIGVGGIKGGVSQALADAINAGTIDPNKINSRTLGIYESIAQAGVDAVGSHAGASGETKAVTDLTSYKSTATRTLGVIDKNLPLVANLADKVNKTGVPGLDQYLQGVKSYTGNNQDVVKYVNSLKTLRSEYAQMLAKGNAATESDKSEAAQAIPAGLSGDAYRALGDQLKLEANNIIQASDDAIQSAKDKSGSNNSTQNNSQTYNVNGVNYHLGADGLYYKQ